MLNAVLLYATAPDAQTARAIAAALVEGRLAACVNILGEIQSVYRWEGAVETAAEWAFLVKTTEQAAPEARRAILSRHPYATPAIVGLAIDGPTSHAGFLDWIQTQTATSG